MLTRTRRFVLTTLIILGIVGIVTFNIPSMRDVLASQNMQATLVVVTSIPTPTNTPFVTPTLPVEATVVPTPEPLLRDDLEIFVHTADTLVESPYVILTVLQKLQTQDVVEIHGELNDTISFICRGTPCQVPLTGDTLLFAQAVTKNGEYGKPYRVTLRVSKIAENQYRVDTEGVQPDLSFKDSCSAVWQMKPLRLSWADFPLSPDGLKTDEPLYYLASRLIETGYVDAKDCPGGGFTAGAVNGCGFARARSAVTAWQNQYDLQLWLVGQQVGIPPKLMKTLIFRESQFWPGRSKNYIDEYGLAQINQLGADAALRWDNELFQEVCSRTLDNCNLSYANLSRPTQAMLRGALVESLLNSECKLCTNGIDPKSAQASLLTIARVLRANCVETNNVFDGQNASPASYEDYWKFTILNYHAGPSCLSASLSTTLADVDINDPSSPKRGAITWKDLSPNIKCSGGLDYVNDFWTILSTFDQRTVNVGASNDLLFQAELLNPPTALPSPTPLLSTARVAVFVYIDKNGNNTFDADEAVNDAIVEIVLPDGNKLSGRTKDGQVVFDMSGIPVGVEMYITLYGQYRSQVLTVPASGDTTLFFKLLTPVIPPSLP